MSTSLQQVVKRSRVSTLDGELKDIAEQMLRDKFGFEEVAQQSAADVFQRASKRTYGGCSGALCELCNRGRFDTRFDNPRSWGARTTRISIESCYELFAELQRNVGPSYKRGEPVWRMGRREFDDLARDVRGRSAIELGHNIKLFGIPVKFKEIDTFGIELVCYM